MIELTDIVSHVEETYNDAISTYEYEGFVRVTNGSGGYMLDLRIGDGQLEAAGKRYGESYDETHEPTMEGLKTALSDGLGL